jgi:hypothetical protein
MPRPAPQWFKENAIWRSKVLQLIAGWAEHENGRGLDAVSRRVVLRRFARLERRVSFYYPGHAPAPFAAEDAAALVVAPRWAANKLVRRMFDTNRIDSSILDGINMDWVMPPVEPAIV